MTTPRPQVLAALWLVLLSLSFPSWGAVAERRALTSADMTVLREVADPQLSPDGEWVAYTVRTADDAKDRRVTQVWMASWDGKRNVQMTYGEHSADTPRWSPDGRYLSFITARGKEENPAHVWLLDLTGGEA